MSLILPLSNTFHHLSDPMTFTRTHTTQENKGGSGAQRTYPNINCQKRLQFVQHLDTHTLVRAERDHVTSSSISVFFCFFATVEDNTRSQESWRSQRLDIYSPAPLCGGQQPLLFRGTIRALKSTITDSDPPLNR